MATASITVVDWGLLEGRNRVSSIFERSVPSKVPCTQPVLTTVVKQETMDPFFF